MTRIFIRLSLCLSRAPPSGASTYPKASGRASHTSPKPRNTAARRKPSRRCRARHAERYAPSENYFYKFHRARWHHGMDDDGSRITEKYEALRGVMDEQMRRLWAADRVSHQSVSEVLQHSGYSLQANQASRTASKAGLRSCAAAPVSETRTSLRGPSCTRPARRCRSGSGQRTS